MLRWLAPDPADEGHWLGPREVDERAKQIAQKTPKKLKAYVLRTFLMRFSLAMEYGCP